MTRQFFAAFAPGAEEIIARIIARSLPEARVLSLQSGAAVFLSAADLDAVRLPCFNNLFLLLHTGPAKPDKAGLDKYLRALPAAHADWPAAREPDGKGKSFRLVTSCQNQLTGVSKSAKDALEKKLAAETRMKVDRSLPDREFWALVRSEGRGYFMKRLTRHRAYDKLLHPGELHPEIAYMLCWLADPRPGGTVLDPFCGYGAIPGQIGRFPHGKLLAFDVDGEALRYSREKLPPEIVVEKRDALRLSQYLPEESVDAVATDPPWGIYQTAGMPLEDFYGAMLRELSTVLKPGGRLVVLTAGKRELAAALEKEPRLRLEERHDMLVSGKKAAVFRMVKAGLKP